ncbi:MAG: protein-glutamate O-methyltransferase CheR [Synergistales bacterium]|nr:protein-glutamate O-methyltransferase CheR [Synergistales bacterium]
MPRTRFSNSLLRKFRDLIYERLGIYFRDEKLDMLRLKLEKIMRHAEIDDHEEFFRLVRAGEEDELITSFMDTITVHTTSFCREPNHFNFIKKNFDNICNHNPRIWKNREIRAWSAGCSTGEEPYSLAMTLHEIVPEQIAVRILATDISRGSLATAIRGIYPNKAVANVEPHLFSKYFRRSREHVMVGETLRRSVSFRQFNLSDTFPFKKGFDILFCRNVMIYFDKRSQQRLLLKFEKALTLGGLLFIGHSESLVNVSHDLKYVQPTVYRKV